MFQIKLRALRSKLYALMQQDTSGLFGTDLEVQLIRNAMLRDHIETLSEEKLNAFIIKRESIPNEPKPSNEALTSELTRLSGIINELSNERNTSIEERSALKAKINALQLKQTDRLKSELLVAVSGGLCANNQTKYLDIPDMAVSITNKILKRLGR